MLEQSYCRGWASSMVSSKKKQEIISRIFYKRAFLTAFAATIPLSVTGCSKGSDELSLCAWYKLRKAATSQAERAKNNDAIATDVEALRAAASFGPHALETAISLNDLASQVLHSKASTPVNDYINRCVAEADFWTKSKPDNPARAVSLSELSEALTNFAGICRLRSDPQQAQKLDTLSLSISQSQAALESPNKSNLLIGYRWGTSLLSLGNDYLAQSKHLDGREALRAAMGTPVASSVPQSLTKQIIDVYTKLSTSGNEKIDKAKLIDELNLSGSGEENSALSQWSKYMKMGKEFLYTKNDAASAEAMFAKAIESAKAMANPANNTGEALYQMGNAYAADNKYAQAESNFIAAAEQQSSDINSRDDLQMTLGKLVLLYKKMRVPEKAETTADRWMKLVRDIYGASSAEYGLALEQYAEIMKMENRFPEAEEKGQKSVDIVSKSVEHDDARLGLSKTILASIYIAEKKFAQARPILADAIEIWSTQRNHNPAAASYADALYASMQAEDRSHAERP